MRIFVAVGLVMTLVGIPSVVAAQDIVADAERLAAEVELQPVGASGGGRSMTRIATTAGLDRRGRRADGEGQA